jgi:deoxyribose-phosphate aldolase
MSKLTKKNLVQFIDHTLLRANAQEKDIAKLCQEALDFKVYSVCVNPRWVSFCKRLLNASAVKTITVVGFPLGADGGVSKSHTSAWAIDQATGTDRS